MENKDRIDAFGAISLTLFSVMLAANQVVIKLVNEGLQPVFSAGLRSVGAIVILFVAFRILGRRLSVPTGAWPALIALGFAFSFEFVLLFTALDLTSVSRTSIIFYSMPVWMAIGAHFWIDGDRLTPVRCLGLVCAMVGVGWAILDRPDSGEASLLGDMLALGAALLWASIGLLTRGTRARDAAPEVQLMVQLVMSAVILLAASAFFGPLIREPSVMTWAGMGFQILVVASLGFLFWLWLLTIYPPSSVASFSFLAPVFGVFFGWFFLNETLNVGVFASLTLVAVGLVLINRKKR